MSASDKTQCPVCSRNMTYRINEDFMECREHGRASGFALVSDDRVERLIAMRSAQMYDWLRSLNRGS